LARFAFGHNRHLKAIAAAYWKPQSNSVLSSLPSFSVRTSLDNALYSQCVSAMCTLAKDPSPRIAGLGRRVLSIIGIEQVVTKSVKPAAASVRPGESSTTASSLAGLARSSSWFDMNGESDTKQ
nr:regulatory-associated protein of TOR 1 isoform X4 [Tanacetum cinerariifolium]